VSTTTIQQNIIYGIGEGALVADTTMLAYALRWANSAYREVFGRYRFQSIKTRSIAAATDGQQTYQAPSDFFGFLTLKDETNETIIAQETAEEFQRNVGTSEIEDETFTSSSDTAVSLDNKAIVQYSERICDDADETTTYTRDTDYTMNYVAGTVTVDSTGSMSDATEYYANYLYYSKNTPDHFCLEYDAASNRYFFRLRPVPDDDYVLSLLYPAVPSDLSGSVAPIWSEMEFCIERGGIYYGALELREPNDPSIERFKRDYEAAIQALIQLDQDLQPKHSRMKVVMRSVDYN